MININNNSRKNIIKDFLPDLTPLLDVVFMLIIFLILSINISSFSLEVNLPEDKDQISKAISDENNISVTILKDSQWKINDNIFQSENAFRTSLKKIYQENLDKKIVIISDKNASVENLINLLTFLTKENISMANIIVDRQ